MQITTAVLERGFGSPVVGLLLSKEFKVTVRNNGTTAVSGLTLTVRLLLNNTKAGDGYDRQIDGFLAGESREFSGWIYYVLGSVFEIEIKVKLGDIVLDVYIY